MKELSKALESYSAAEEHKRRLLEMFKYDTLDEADPKKERIRGDVTIELGSPAGGLRIAILTREEHTTLKDALESIVKNRLISSGNEIDKLCLERVNKGNL